MTFDSREKSRNDAQPVECYRFAQGDRLWLLTTADQAVTLPTGTYQPDVLVRGALNHNQEDGSGSLEITVPRDSSIAEPFILFVPTTRITLTVYRAHRGDESLAEVKFVGTVSSVVFDGSAAKVRCAPLQAAFTRTVPRQTFHGACAWALYGPGCGVDSGAFRDTALLGTVSGITLTSSDFALRASGWYTNGWLQGPGGDIRFVVDHVGSTVTLMSAMPGLASGQTVQIFAGCARTEAVCASKFANLDNFLGFPRIPSRDPQQKGLY